MCSCASGAGLINSVVNGATPRNSTKSVAGDVDDKIVGASGLVANGKAPNGDMIYTGGVAFDKCHYCPIERYGSDGD
jgi:hypothetical protein